MRQPEARNGSKRFEDSRSVRPAVFFFSKLSSESNSEVPGSEVASHLELRETKPPDVHVADDVDGKHLEQSFRELEVTEELHWINVTKVESSRDVISSR